MAGKFDGIIGGPPCQDFSTLKRDRGEYSSQMLLEYIRIVEEAQPNWWLLENVRSVPDVQIDGYEWQRIDINQAWYSDTSRLRHIQFGSRDGTYLDIPRGDTSGAKHSCALASDNRSFRELCYLQGLSEDYDLPSFNMAGKKRAVGNGVPLVMGRVLANAVAKVTQQHRPTVTIPGATPVTDQVGGGIVSDLSDKSVTHRHCPCGCRRVLTGRKQYYDASCRKRAQRRREATV
jgi:DNA (cytosine-5)-methyltransferase 1